MAIDFVPVNQTSRFGRDLVALRNVLQTARERIAAIKDHMDHMNDGSTFTMIPTEFGLPSGSGSAALTIITNAKAALDDAAILTLVQRVG